jgi:chromosome partitioning protein
MVAEPYTIQSKPGAMGPTGRPLPVFPDPEPLLTHGPARIIAVCNQKGGVGKTTTTINLGAALAEQGRRVLLVDFDPQGALSVGLGFQPHELEYTVYNLLLERGRQPGDVVFKTNVDGMDLLPSNIDLSGAEVQLVHEVGREFVLGGVLEPLLPDYDIVLIDCQPSLGLLTVNALACAAGARAAGVRVLRAARGGAAAGDHRQGVEEAQSGPRHRWPAGHHVRLADAAFPGSSRRGGEGIRRQGVSHRDQPHRAIPGRHRGRRADHPV